MISPHRYAHQVRAVININMGALVSVAALRNILKDGANADKLLNGVVVPACIPVKYRNAVRRTLAMATVRAIFESLDGVLSLQQRHQIIQDCYKALEPRQELSKFEARNFVKQSRDKLQSDMTGSFANLLLAAEKVAPGVCAKITQTEADALCQQVPQKYADRIRGVLAMAFIAAVFKKAKYQMALPAKHAIIQKTMESIRER